jgi:hypothetical protein
MKVKGREDDKQEPRGKEPIEMTSDELLDYSLHPELADEVKRVAKPPEESTDLEQEC